MTSDIRGDYGSSIPSICFAHIALTVFIFIFMFIYLTFSRLGEHPMAVSAMYSFLLDRHQAADVDGALTVNILKVDYIADLFTFLTERRLMIVPNLVTFSFCHGG